MSEKNYVKYFTQVERHEHYFYPKDEAIFVRYTIQNGVLYLKCLQTGCRAKGRIFNHVFSRTNGEITHQHPDSENFVHHRDIFAYERVYEQLRNDVKNNARLSLQSLHTIAQASLTTRHAKALLDWDKVRGCLLKIRRDIMPPCHSFEDLISLLEDRNGVIFKDYGQMGDGEDLYIGCIGKQMMFANFNIIDDLPAEFSIFVDATFGVTLFESCQLLVVLAEIANKPRPIFYALMSGQATEDYQIIFSYIQDYLFGDERKPTFLMSDAEQAIRKAARSVWPEIDSRICNFHFCQALRRYANSIATLAHLLKPDSIHHMILLMFMRLSLLPRNKFEQGYIDLIQFIADHNKLAEFASFTAYFDATWRIRFRPDDWCVGDLRRRTNNNIEGYNNKIKKIIPNNPSPFTFLEGISTLALKASSSYDSDRIRNVSAPADRSHLSAPLKENLQKLNTGEITNIEFLIAMAGYEEDIEEEIEDEEI